MEKRFKLASDNWDFSTIIGGKLVTPSSIPEEVPVEIPAEIAEEPIKPEELTKELNKIYEIPETKEKTLTFERLEDFNNWYLVNRQHFARGAMEALNTLVNIQRLIQQGCKCLEKERRGAGYGYYQSFFLKNVGTDIISTIKSISGCDKIVFKSPDNPEPFLTV